MLKVIKRIFRKLIQFFMSFSGSIMLIIGGFFKMIAVCFLLCIVLAIGIYAYIKPDLDASRDKAYDILANVSESDFYMPSNTIIYDNQKNIIGEINAGRFVYKPIESISLNIQNAYISQEDKRFKEHTGVDWISTARAAVSLIKHKGKITQGGSTITQQLIKNTYLTQEQTFKRKMVEILLAPQLEKKFSKTQIMEYYCNTNFYGNRCYGVEAACQFYFGKPASQVSIAQAALLAGLSNAPATYDPISHPEDALEKRNSIITNMRENGFISNEEEIAALNEPMTILAVDSDTSFETYQSSYAIHCAAIELMKKNGFELRYLYNNKEDYKNYSASYDKVYTDAVNQIRRGGYKIYTSLDSNIQNMVQQEIDNGLTKFTETDDATGKYKLQGAAVVVDNTSGSVVAIVGGRGTSDALNRGFQSARQPGSCIKPLIDYAPAFNSGMYFPSKMINDHEFENGPQNADGSYHGMVSIREALNRSLNTVAWQVMQGITPKYGLSFLEKMEFRKMSYVDNNSDAISIGGFTNGVRVVDMAKGFATLANNGRYSNNTCIVSMTDINDVPVLNNLETKYTQVYDAASAYMVTDILKGTLTKEYGTGHGLSLNCGMPAAAKTGTTNNNKDAWMCGYTPYYSVAVWMGYDLPKQMEGVYGATYSGKIWKNIMDHLNADKEYKDFDIPDGVVLMETKENGDPIRETEKSYDGGSIPGGYDLFSIAAEKKYEESANELVEKQLEEKVRKNIDNYLNFTISSLAQFDTIDKQYTDAVNQIYLINNSKDRETLFDKVEEKNKELQELKENAKIDLENYHKQEEERIKQEIEESKAKAEEEYRKEVRGTREKEFNNYYDQIMKLEYKPENNELILNLENALTQFEEYDDYQLFADKYNEANEFLNALPYYADWKQMQETTAPAELQIGPARP